VVAPAATLGAMPRPRNERQALEEERAELPGQIAVYRQEMENGRATGAPSSTGSVTARRNSPASARQNGLVAFGPVLGEAT
jgi:hypothetical protein